MELPRKYSADEIQDIVDLFRDSPDISSGESSGMEYLASLLKHYESKTEEDIAAEVRAFCRENPFFTFKSSD